MKPFLLLATRAEQAPADQEYTAFLECGALSDDQLIRHRLEEEPLGDIDLDALSGIILGGSPFTVTDPIDTKSDVQVRVELELRELLDRVIAQDFPFLGACYGIGVIGAQCGALVDRTYAEPVGPVSVSLTDAGKVDPLLYDLPSPFEAFVGHKEAISKLPEDAVALATSSACPVQAFRLGANVYATQFHPELDVPGIVTRIEAYKDYGYFEPERAEELKETARASNVQHPAAIVRRFVELYQQ
ncbi:MAG TPA: glutamine amidotransferase [Nocardioidaceae bacterium]|nr:glutamine amidotransferase [Nocardioidaceae bacterium]